MTLTLDNIISEIETKKEISRALFTAESEEKILKHIK